MGGKDGIKTDQPGFTEFSNSIRLTGWEWLVVGLFAVLLVVGAPHLWKKAEPFTVEPDYRIPYDLGHDYWLYERYTGMAAERYDTLVIGDSVVWGEYVTPHKTLSHYLNELAGRERFANLGLDGAEPLALAGLVEHYAGGVRGKNVILHCNLLWLSSPATDRQDVEETARIDHPHLLPQFSPRIPSYKEEVSPRLGALVEQRLPFNGWANHLQQAYYDRTDIPDWTVEHPYDNPLKPLTRGLPHPDEALRHLEEPWYKNSATRKDYPWVDPDASLQWPAFQRVVEVLRRRGNRVFVLVGPFNEHMMPPPVQTRFLARPIVAQGLIAPAIGAPALPQALVSLRVATLDASALTTPGSIERYQHVKAKVADWLEAQHIPHAVPDPLPRDEYGDASHPLAAGYKRLAGLLHEQLPPQ
jgi:hypothetical protein